MWARIIVRINPQSANSYLEESVIVRGFRIRLQAGPTALSTSNGSDTLTRGLQILQDEAELPVGTFTFAIYDQVRNHFYLTGGGNSVAVFDPTTKAFLSPLESSAISAGAVLQGEALTPDSSTLAVAGPTDQL